MKKSKQVIFCELIEKMELTQPQLSRWMTQKNSKAGREAVRKKSKAIIGVTQTDIGLLRAIEYLFDLGFDVSVVEFDENLEIAQPLPKRSGMK